MSTDRVEIKPDVTEKSLEQSAEDLKKNDGVDVSKDIAVNADGEGAKIRQLSQEEMQQSTQDKTYENEARPAWLPEKFKNAEELAKAYTGLEKEFSSRPKEEAKPTEAVQEVQDKGLDKYYGLLELAEKYDIFKKVSTRYELPDGSKQFGKTILNDPETYFTDEIMSKLDEAASKEFKYGGEDS